MTTAIAATAAPPTAIIRMPFLSPPRFVMPEPNDDIGSNASDGVTRRARALVSRGPDSNSSGGAVVGGSGAGALLEPDANAGVPLVPRPPMPFIVAAGDGGGGPPRPPDSQPFAVDTSDDRSGPSPVGAAGTPRTVAAGETPESCVGEGVAAATRGSGLEPP